MQSLKILDEIFRKRWFLIVETPSRLQKVPHSQKTFEGHDLSAVNRYRHADKCYNDL